MPSSSKLYDTPLIQDSIRQAKCAHPLGPLLGRHVSMNPSRTRSWAALWLGLCLGVLGLATWLQPDARGLGTHTQLGLAPCTMPQTLGIPCIGCGLTTSFAHTVRGQWISAFDAQPAGLVLCILVGFGAFLSMSSLISGQAWRLNLYRFGPLKIALSVVGLLLGGWGYKIVAMLLDPADPAAW